MGVSKEQHQKVLEAIELARTEGCTLMVGGEKTSDVALDSSLQSGYWVKPTILTDVPISSRTWLNEIFGPVLAIRTFKTEEEAIQVVNDTTYGLGNAVLSADV